jgi:hypothetical protein
MKSLVVYWLVLINFNCKQISSVMLLKTSQKWMILYSRLGPQQLSSYCVKISTLQFSGITFKK